MFRLETSIQPPMARHMYTLRMGQLDWQTGCWWFEGTPHSLEHLTTLFLVCSTLWGGGMSLLGKVVGFDSPELHPTFGSFSVSYLQLKTPSNFQFPAPCLPQAAVLSHNDRLVSLCFLSSSHPPTCTLHRSVP